MNDLHHPETIDISSHLNGLRFELTVTALRLASVGQVWDVIDFRQGLVKRWCVPSAPMPFDLDTFRTMFPDQNLSVTAGSIYGCMLTPHVAQMSPDGMMVVSYLNGMSVQVLDTRSGRLHTYAATPDGRPWQHSATGGFSKDGKQFYFVRWPLDGSIAIAGGATTQVRCQLCRLDLRDMTAEIVAEIDYLDEVHQITPSGDERYLVFTTFNARPVVPMPKRPVCEAADDYRRSFESGLPPREMVTHDLRTGRHWRTLIPTPRPAHFEVDPRDPHVFYVSAHNFADSSDGVLLNGQASLYRMRILDGRTVIEAEYTSPDLFRVTQHMPFVRDGKTLVAVTNVPNKLDILDAKSMTLWRRVVLFNAPEVYFTNRCYIKSPGMRSMCLSLSPSASGRYIVLQSFDNLLIYDIAADQLLDVVIPIHGDRSLSVVGHNRPVHINS